MSKVRVQGQWSRRINALGISGGGREDAIICGTEGRVDLARSDGICYGGAEEVMTVVVGFRGIVEIWKLFFSSRGIWLVKVIDSESFSWFYVGTGVNV